MFIHHDFLIFNNKNYIGKTGEEWFIVEEQDYIKVHEQFRLVPPSTSSIIKKTFTKSIPVKHTLEFYKKAKFEDQATTLETQYNIGLIYQIGKYTKKDYAEALHWFKKSAEFDHAQSNEKIARCYYQGNGVKQSYTEAKIYYKKAAKKGDSEAQFRLGLFYHDGLGSTQNYTQALFYYQSSAESDHVYALYNLAVLYENGQGVLKNYEKAFEYYFRAAHAGDYDAKLKLGLFCSNGFGTEQDHKQLFLWYKEIIEINNKDIKIHCRIAELYKNGQGTDQDSKLAFDHLTKAVKLDSTEGKKDGGESHIALGKMYFDGIGTEQDNCLAMLMFQKALIISNNSEAKPYIKKLKGKRPPFLFFSDWAAPTKPILSPTSLGGNEPMRRRITVSKSDSALLSSGVSPTSSLEKTD